MAPFISHTQGDLAPQPKFALQSNPIMPKVMSPPCVLCVCMGKLADVSACGSFYMCVPNPTLPGLETIGPKYPGYAMG